LEERMKKRKRIVGKGKSLEVADGSNWKWGKGRHRKWYSRPEEGS
jgi:hypothetical protein